MPPESPAIAPWDRRDTLVLALLVAGCACLYLLRLGDCALDNRGEPREGMLTQEIVYHGEWLLPRPNGTRWPEKPILFPWLAALSAYACGGDVTEWSLRFPSAILGALGVGLVFLIGRRLGARGEAALAAAVLALAVGWFGLARRARLDMTLAVLMSAGMYSFLRAYASRTHRGAWGLSAALWLALATLTKGPIGFVFPLGGLCGLLGLRAALDRGAAAGAPPAPLRASLEREARILWEMRPLLAGGLFLLLVSAWYVPAAIDGGPEFRYVNLWKENIGMPLGLEEGGGHQHHVLWYLPHLFGTFAPWCLFLPFALAWTGVRARRAPSAENLFPLAWAAVFFVGLSVAAGKRPDYLVILHPALALITGAWLWRACAAPREHRWSLQAPLLALGAGALAAALLAAGVTPVERLDGAIDLRLVGFGVVMAGTHKGALGPALVEHQATVMVLLALLGASCLLCRFLLRGERLRAAAALFGANALVLYLAAILVVLPEVRDTDSLKPFALETLAYVGPEKDRLDLVMANDFTYAIPFYLRRRVPWLHPALMKAFLAPGRRRFCIATEPVYAEYRQVLGTQVEVLARSAATDAGRYLLIAPAGTKPLSSAGAPDRKG